MDARTEEIRARVEKRIPEFIVPDDVTHLLTALTALREALLKRQRFLHNAQVHPWREFEKCDNAECIEARELAALSPSPAQEEPKQD